MKSLNEFLIKNKISGNGKEFRIYIKTYSSDRHPAYIRVNSLKDYEYLKNHISMKISESYDKGIRNIFAENPDGPAMLTISHNTRGYQISIWSYQPYSIE